ncbi:hypothetical protein CK503_02390 [Aliifodinibius salipaludis]|uniref:Uncharacterized protein n=1 Tax=Fodinibius salipaludis TaxID=2032627 RepID=A0A2A2GDS9_9BACT|nr:hypothetical protein CK503_02390 [Aliifodinibius salipaludis]
MGVVFRYFYRFPHLFSCLLHDDCYIFDYKPETIFIIGYLFEIKLYEHTTFGSIIVEKELLDFLSHIHPSVIQRYSTSI